MKKTMIWSILEMTIGFKRFKIMRSTSSYVKDIHGYCSSSLATSRYPTNRTTKAIWKPSEAKFRKKPWQVELALCD